MGEQGAPILKDSFVSAACSGRVWPRRVKGSFVVAGAVLACGLCSWSTPSAAAPAGSSPTRTDPQAHVAQSEVRKPTGLSECSGKQCECSGKQWGMSRLHGSTVWVGDHATGRIHVYRLDGTQLRVINTRLGRDRLTGFRVESDGSLSVLDVRENRTVRLRASQT
jgi:hypothetical protein